MILRDFYCEPCGAIVPDVEADDVTMLLLCPRCNATTHHSAVCNGGVGSRFRHNDWPTDDPEFYRGQTSSSVSASYYDDDGNEHDLTDPAGNAMHARPRFTDPERRAEREDRYYFDERTKRGRRTIYLDAKGNQS